MKKFLSVILVCLLLLFSVSCLENGKGNDTDSSGIETDRVEIKCSYTYEIEEEIVIVDETEGGARSTKLLRYPKISGMENAEIQTKINNLLSDKANEMYVRLVPDVEIYIMEETLFNYEVTSVEVTYASDNFLSVKSETYLMTSLSAYPEKAVYTLNMDLSDGSIILEEDIYADFTAVAAKFIAGDFEQIYGIDDLMENTSYEDMILQYKSDYANYPQTCFTPTSLIINIDLVNSLGTSAGFSISLDEVRDFLKFVPSN